MKSRSALPPPALDLRINEALEYVSRKLSRAKLSPISAIVIETPWTVSSFPASFRIVPTSPLEPKARKVLAKTLEKAAKKFSVASTWVKTLSDLLEQTDPVRDICNADLIRRSLRQNRVAFSSEGLTLFEADYTYTLKARLSHLAANPGIDNEIRCIESLETVVVFYGGRPVSEGYLKRAYDHINVPRRTLAFINGLYASSHNHSNGIVFTDDASSPPPTTTAKFPRSISRQLKHRGVFEPEMPVLKGRTPSPDLAVSTPSAGLRVSTCDTPPLHHPLSQRNLPGEPTLSSGNTPPLHHLPSASPRMGTTAFPLFKGDIDVPIILEMCATPPGSVELELMRKRCRTPEEQDLLEYETGRRLDRYERELLALGPITPNTASECSPGTKTEWFFLINGVA